MTTAFKHSVFFLSAVATAFNILLRSKVFRQVWLKDSNEIRNAISATHGWKVATEKGGTAIE